MILLKQTNHKHSMKTSPDTDLQSQQTTVGETETTKQLVSVPTTYRGKKNPSISSYEQI